MRTNSVEFSSNSKVYSLDKLYPIQLTSLLSVHAPVAACLGTIL